MCVCPYLSIYISVYLSFYVFIYLYIYISIFLCVYLYFLKLYVFIHIEKVYSLLGGSFERKSIRPEVRLQLRLFVVVFPALGLCNCAVVTLLFWMSLLRQHRFFKNNFQETARVRCPCRRAGFSVLSGLDVWCCAWHWNRLILAMVFVFASMFGGFSFGRVSFSFALSGAASGERDQQLGNAFASHG